jgi:hypothetical protein
MSVIKVTASIPTSPKAPPAEPAPGAAETAIAMLLSPEQMPSEKDAAVIAKGAAAEVAKTADGAGDDQQQGNLADKQGPPTKPKKPRKPWTAQAKNAIPGVPKEVFTKDEARQYLGNISRSMMDQLEGIGHFKGKPRQFPRIMIGSRPYYRKNDLDAYLAKLAEAA